MQLECPYDQETFLSDIVDSLDAQLAVSSDISVFKKQLTPEQRQAFNKIDDKMLMLITKTQENTLRKTLCQYCSRKEVCETKSQ